ncbi:MAG TPA: hypothetical protein VF980_19830 [Thermoanaerobaculia bacterium]
MTSVAQAVASRAPRPRFLTRAALAILWWSWAAAFVVMAQQTFGRTSLAAVIVAKAVVILLAGAAYVKFARDCSVEHAIVVGAAWIVLSVAAELIVSTQTHHAWYGLLGPESSQVVRDLLLILWVASPAVSARRS